MWFKYQKFSALAGLDGLCLPIHGYWHGIGFAIPLRRPLRFGPLCDTLLGAGNRCWWCLSDAALLAKNWPEGKSGEWRRACDCGTTIGNGWFLNIVILFQCLLPISFIISLLLACINILSCFKFPSHEWLIASQFPSYFLIASTTLIFNFTE